MQLGAVIVDKEDTPIGHKDRSEITYDDIYRVSAVWLTDIKTGDVLLAQRKMTLRTDPGKWAAAAAGTIEGDESYDESIVHETYEEIGLKGLDFQTGPKVYVDDGQHKFFCQWYLAQVDKNNVVLTLQEDEVERARWLSPVDLVRDFRVHPGSYVLSMEQTLRLLKLV